MSLTRMSGTGRSRVVAAFVALTVATSCSTAHPPRRLPTPSATSSPLGAAPCTPRDLRLSYRGGGLGTGNDFGEIVVRDVGVTPCALSGSVSVQALRTPNGPLITIYGGGTNLRGPSTFPAGLILTPNAPPDVGTTPLPTNVTEAAISLQGGERDDPKTGAMCATSDEVTPGDWKVEMAGSTFVVANRQEPPGPDGPAGLFACRANFNLEGARRTE